MKQYNQRRGVVPFLGVIFLVFCVLSAESAELTTAEVKARYIHSFVKYVTWPAEKQPQEEFAVRVVNSGGVKVALEAATANKKVNGATIRIQGTANVGASVPEHVIYTEETDRDLIGEVVQKAPPGTLTIGEGPNFLARGGMIEFRLKEGKVRFAVNLKALRDGGFQVDSKLLAIAEEVTGK